MNFRLALLALVVAAAPAVAQPKSRKVAFLVGVGDFKHNLPDLKGVPQRDVAELGKELRANGFDVVTLTDKEATKEGVEARFKAVLRGDGDPKKAIGKRDVILVSLCTHGFTMEVTDPVLKAKWKEPLLAGWDAIPGDAASMISLRGFFEATGPFGVTALYLVDACRETTDPNRGTGGLDASQVRPPANSSVLFSCRSGQLSHQSEKLGGGHGLFTFAVLKALRGETGLRGEVTWLGLASDVGKSFRSADFVKDYIPTGLSQTPLAAQGETGDVALLTIAGRPGDVAAKPPAEKEIVHLTDTGKNRRVALLIGVGEFAHGLQNLDGIPEHDVAQLSAVLKAGGFTTITLSGKEATRKAIAAQLDALVKGRNPLAKGDTLLVAFCGHGFRADVKASNGALEDHSFFCPYDAKPETPETMVSLTWVFNQLSPTGTTSLFLIDASQPRDGNRGLSESAMNVPAKTSALFSCSRGEARAQSKVLKHGLFTYSVIKVLTGETGLIGEVSWSDFVGNVEKTFASPALKKLRPGSPQTPIEMKGELSYTKLLDGPVQAWK